MFYKNILSGCFYWRRGVDIMNDFFPNLSQYDPDHKKVIASTGAPALKLPQRTFWAAPGKKPLIIFISRTAYRRKTCDHSF